MMMESAMINAPVELSAETAVAADFGADNCEQPCAAQFSLEMIVQEAAERAIANVQSTAAAEQALPKTEERPEAEGSQLGETCTAAPTKRRWHAAWDVPQPEGEAEVLVSPDSAGEHEECDSAENYYSKPGPFLTSLSTISLGPIAEDLGEDKASSCGSTFCDSMSDLGNLS
eukprot:TRINITY_DN6025_c0_g1_i8.p2 TRINITY_DN6025_c0_g1~~TRINITY_DN6025_c0_g1_i8.p2  ORF type:complete len:172 (+),score=49.85 TRINITY_DN6025_c0_g1_i8:89-604(+)